MYSKFYRVLKIFIVCLLTSFLLVSCETFDEEKIPASTSVILVEEPVIELIDEPVLFPELIYKRFYNIELTQEYCNKFLESSNVIDSAITSGTFCSEAISAMELEYERLQSIIQMLQSDINQYIVWENEYYYAAKTYEFLKRMGYNDAVSCGIIGNMMVETAGGTLKLKPTVYSPSGTFYGLCQWSAIYHPEARGLSFDQQLEYLANSISVEFKTFGWLYKKDFTYEDFLAITNPMDAAYAFAKVYERCFPVSLVSRTHAAKVAYDYFCTND